LEALDRSDRKWRLATFPAALAVAAAIYLASLVLGIPGVSVWILTNILLVLGVLHGAQLLRDRKRGSLMDQKSELALLAQTTGNASLPLGPSGGAVAPSQ
jgi:hypothetical protein